MYNTIKMSQFLNLLEFTLLILSIYGRGMLQISWDYFDEKFQRYIGFDIELKFNEKHEELDEYIKLWLPERIGKDHNLFRNSKLVNNIYWFIYEVVDKLKMNGILGISPIELKNIFLQTIGNPQHIKEERWNFAIHETIRERWFKIYLKEYERFFKIINILEKKF